MHLVPSFSPVELSSSFAALPEPVHSRGRTSSMERRHSVVGSSAMARGLAHLSDEAVVALAARSDEAALAELYDRFGRVAYGLALRMLRDRALAEDAVQEGFLAVWRNAHRFVPERAKASTWILTLVHRRTVDIVRREERRRADALELAPEPVSDAADESAWLRFE